MCCIFFTHRSQGQIFVNIAYESTSYHTAGFLCLQIGLILIALQNVLYVTLTDQTYKIFDWFHLHAHHTSWLGWTYLFLNLLICIPKVGATVYIVKHGVGPEFYKADGFFRDKLGQDIDFVWMFFNAVLPGIFAAFRMVNEEPITFDISLPAVVNPPGGEKTPLAPGGGSKGGYSSNL